MNKKLKILIITTAVASISTLSVAPAMAASYDSTGQKIGFFERIALMLGFKKELGPAKQSARIEQMKQKHEAKQTARLDALVRAGKITDAQRTELEARLEAIEQAKSASAGQTKEQRKESTKQARDALKSWAESNGLDLSELMPKRSQTPRHAR